VVAEDSGVLKLEAKWIYLLWRGLQQLEADVSSKRATATTYTEMGAFNRAHKDIVGLIAALKYLRISEEGSDGYVLLQEPQHPGVVAVLQDPD
jgi:hypothetical protein